MGMIRLRGVTLIAPSGAVACARFTLRTGPSPFMTRSSDQDDRVYEILLGATDVVRE